MKNKNLAFLALFVFLIALATSFANGLDKVEGEGKGLNYFKGTLADALKASKKQGKPVFIDAYTDWCGWCKKLDKSTFADARVIETLNSKFIVIKMNMEEGEGPEVAQKYGINGYPTLLYFDAKGIEIHRIGGFVKADEFLKESEAALLKYKN